MEIFTWHQLWCQITGWSDNNAGRMAITLIRLQKITSLCYHVTPAYHQFKTLFVFCRTEEFQVMMSVGAHASGFFSQIISTPLSAVPGLILTGYTEYLWSYKPNSWVAKIASIFRVLALLAVLPVVFLGVLVCRHVKFLPFMR